MITLTSKILEAIAAPKDTITNEILVGRGEDMQELITDALIVLNANLKKSRSFLISFIKKFLGTL